MKLDVLRKEGDTVDLLVTATETPSTVEWSSWIAAGATLTLAVLTYVYVRLTRRILESQSDPCVIVTVVHDEDRRTMLKLVARNIGSGMAHDIRFEFSRPIPSRAFGISTAQAKPADTMKDGPFVDGIPALGPGESREVDWGQYGGLKVALGDTPVVATVRFRKGAKEVPPMLCPLEVESFTGTVASQSASAELVQEIKKIAKSISHLETGFHKLKIEVVSMPESNKDNSAK